MSPALPAVGLDVPVEPDPATAREWLIEELAKPEYRASEPTWFDQASRAVRDWFTGLFSAGTGGSDAVLLSILVVLIVAVIVATIVIFGRPRINRRTRAVVLFGERDERSADELRRAAAGAAAAADWSLAITERFRAIARTASDRTAVSVLPGTTADEFARRAGDAFPDSGADLAAAARIFDGVRYLGGVGSAEDYRRLVDLDVLLQETRPVLHAGIGVPA